jgi:NADPH:quinone reductase-like Zn-dependent oxidoreductase
VSRNWPSASRSPRSPQAAAWPPWREREPSSWRRCPASYPWQSRRRGQRHHPARAGPRRRAGLRRVLDLLTGGRLDIAITEVSSLAEVPAVHQLLAEGRGEGKYVARLVG